MTKFTRYTGSGMYQKQQETTDCPPDGWEPYQECDQPSWVGFVYDFVPVPPYFGEKEKRLNVLYQSWGIDGLLTPNYDQNGVQMRVGDIVEIHSHANSCKVKRGTRATVVRCWDGGADVKLHGAGVKKPFSRNSLVVVQGYKQKDSQEEKGSGDMYVVCVEQDGPTGSCYIFATEQDARAKAEKLAKDGGKYHVLKTIDSCEVNAVKWASDK